MDEVKNQVNQTLRIFNWNISLELRRWEIDAYPALHLEGAQGVIDSDLKIEDCDVLVAIFWKSIGRPYRDGRVSNTEHEIETAYDAWKRCQRPQILFFFSQQPYPPPQSSEELDQWKKVLDLRSKWSDRGLVQNYTGIAEFSSLAFLALMAIIHSLNPQYMEPDSETLILHEGAHPVIVRSEGITELTGDITLTFEARKANQPPNLNLLLFFNTTVTNEIQAGLNSPTFAIDGSSLIVRSRIFSANGVLFEGIQLPALKEQERVYCRISNVRINANALGVGTAKNPTPIVGVIALKTQDAGLEGPALFQRYVTVALIQRGLAFKVSTLPDNSTILISQPDGINGELAQNPTTASAPPTFYVTFSEQHAGAFKSRVQESGSGIARGTRLKIVLCNIPQGILIFVTTRNVSSSIDSQLRATLVPGEMGESSLFISDSTPLSGPLMDGRSIQQLTVTNGAATAVWEWVKEGDPSSSIANVVFGVVVAAEPGKASFGTATVNGSLAPTTTVTVAADPPIPIPRFADTSTATNVFCVVR
jgi:hypothetical protein